MYIGKTESNIEKRFQEHIKDSKRERCKDRPLYRAINKYGIENFKIELLEESDNSEEREQYYIKKFNTYGSTGYNATLGGDSKRYLNYEDIIKCYEKYQNITKVAELKGCHVDSVRSVLKNNNIKIQQPGWNMKKFGIKVDQFNLYDEYIRTFNSYSEAARWIVENNYSKDKRIERIASKIIMCCNKERKTAYKFKWKTNHGKVAESGLLQRS